jgi:5-methylcytosine-specific restriction endonuclease McrA
MRTVKEWIGKTDDSVPPPHVRLRVFIRFAGVCGICTTKIRVKKWVCDHKKAICNGGQNRETNLWPIHETCDRKVKTPRDVAERAVNDRVAMRHLGIKRHKGPALPGTRASGVRKRMNGDVEKW